MIYLIVGNNNWNINLIFGGFVFFWNLFGLFGEILEEL